MRSVPKEKVCLKQQTLAEIANVLDPAQFVRIHRSIRLEYRSAGTPRALRERQPRRHPARWNPVARQPSGYTRLSAVLK